VTSSSSTQPTVRQVGKLTLTVKSDTEIELTRELSAPRELVWRAMSSCEHIQHWWGPARYPFSSCEMDFRPGGHWRFVTRGDDGAEYAFRGEYREIVPFDRIVQTFEFEGMPGATSIESMTLEEHDGKTTVRVFTTYDSKEALDGMLSSGMEGGAAETYDRLEAYLLTLS
jgi:uncharacterized protein YndB with AHSA1/START domain